MAIKKICDKNIKEIAKLMSTIKPEFWDYNGALCQLNKGIGWVVEDNTEIKGWLLVKEYKKYSVLEIECLGYNEDGEFAVNANLNPLILKAQQWAQNNSYRMIRFVIGSRGLSCHQKKLGDIWKELKELRAIQREEFDWFLNLGFKPMGILPNTYGEGFHGIMLIKTL